MGAQIPVGYSVSVALLAVPSSSTNGWWSSKCNIKLKMLSILVQASRYCSVAFSNVFTSFVYRAFYIAELG
ncbi:hypothetical protein BJV82DRAFT_618751, partial [Fennellomyces sp. T-0311]